MAAMNERVLNGPCRTGTPCSEVVLALAPVNASVAAR
jgi:hypothetical protein